jgi:hypothetical protein
MATPDNINAKQKKKVEQKYPGSTSTDIYIGGSKGQNTSKPKHKRSPKLPVFKVREVRDKMV